MIVNCFHSIWVYMWISFTDTKLSNIGVYWLSIHNVISMLSGNLQFMWIILVEFRSLSSVNVIMKYFIVLHRQHECDDTVILSSPLVRTWICRKRSCLELVDGLLCYVTWYVEDWIAYVWLVNDRPWEERGKSYRITDNLMIY